MTEIYDCTLREGEQADGASFNLEDRLRIVRLLDGLGVDYIEMGWPIARQDIMESFKQAGKLELKKAKIVAFGSTSISDAVSEDKNLNSIVESGARYACIFGKTSLSHIERQLKISAEDNLRKISESVEFLRSRGIEVFYDAEHFFDSYKDNPEYAIKTLEAAVKAGAVRIILCDTNGGTLPEEASNMTRQVKNSMNAEVGVHFHNDCGLALANSLACLPYVNQIQATVNGIGERVGNTDLCELLPNLVLKLGLKMDIKLEKLKELSEEVYKAANLPEQITQAFVSPRAFLHKGGVHIDATLKGASYEHINPEHLGLEHHLIFSSLGGAACIVNTAAKFGYAVDKRKEKDKITQLLGKLAELESKGYDLGNTEAEQEILIEKYFGNWRDFFSVVEWNILTEEKESECYVKCSVGSDNIEKTVRVSGGPVDAVYHAIISSVREKYDIELKIADYKVRIARARGAESTVRTKIEFSDGNKFEAFEAIGVNENVIASGIEAISKGLNYYIYKKLGKADSK